METLQLHNILESCLLVAGKAMSLAQLEMLFDEDIDRPERSEIKEALVGLQASYEGRGIELIEVSSGWRLQSAESMQHWVARMFEERPPRYSRALLETLVLIAYRQPITRGEIEEVRGVAVSSNIIRTLQEREWIKEMGFKDVPGKPALWGTTKGFLDYFNLKQLDELPTLAEARDLAEIDAALAAELGVVEGADDAVAANDDQGDDVQSEGEQGESAEGQSTDGVNVDSASVEDASAEDASAEDISAEATSLVQQEGEQSESSIELLNASFEGEGSNTDESGLTDLANKLNSDIVDTGEPKLADLAVGLEAETGVADEPELADLADDLEIEANAMDETQLADLAGYLENQLVGADQPKLADLSIGLEAEIGDPDESNLTDVASSLETESGNEEQADNATNERSVVEASEISAFDLDVEQWPERKVNPTAVENVEHLTASQEAFENEDGVEDKISNDTEGSTNSDSDNDGTDSLRGEAEADLRRVIDDFAEEHQKQLDDRDLHRAEFNERHSSAPKPAFELNGNKISTEQVVSGDDGHSGSSEKSSDGHDSIDAEVGLAERDSPDQGESSDKGTPANSGEP